MRSLQAAQISHTGVAVCMYTSTSVQVHTCLLFPSRLHTIALLLWIPWCVAVCPQAGAGGHLAVAAQMGWTTLRRPKKATDARTAA